MPEVADILRAAGTAETLSEAEEFVAACARGDAAEARRIQTRRPDLPASFSGCFGCCLIRWHGGLTLARVMVALGWPIATRGGDWSASALNLAVFRGDANLTEFLLAHGASWREEHGYGDDVIGTLSWTSINAPVEGGAWVAVRGRSLRTGCRRRSAMPPMLRLSSLMAGEFAFLLTSRGSGWGGRGACLLMGIVFGRCDLDEGQDGKAQDQRPATVCFSPTVAV